MSLNVRELDNRVINDVEKTILSMAINSKTANFSIITQLENSDFYDRKNRIIFSAITELAKTSEELDIIKVSSYLQEQNLLSNVGGQEYLVEINGLFTTDLGVEDYIKIIFKNSVGRKIEKFVKEANNYIEEKMPVDEMLLKIQNSILGISTNIRKDNAEEIKLIIDEVINKIHDLEENGDAINGVDTGFKELDRITNGWQKSDLVILAARPSMGKTALALSLAKNAARIGRKKVSFFSLEMPKDQLVQRILSMQSKVMLSKIRNARSLEKIDWSKMTGAVEKIKDMSIVIDDTPGLNILDIQTKLRKQKRDFDIDVCFIDYLQLIGGISGRNENRQNEVAAISRQLKNIARELEIPIICLSQLSRSVEKREDKTPLMSDLRDSGAIEQDADLVLFLHRPNYYEKNDQVQQDNREDAQIIISKHRNGSTGDLKINFFKEYASFED